LPNNPGAAPPTALALERTTKSSVAFKHAFLLHGLEHAQPPGTYSIEVDEELIQSLSFPAYRRVCTRITLAPDPAHPGFSDTAVIDAADLAAALARDAISDDGRMPPQLQS
jgi:hypothetical protein